MKIQEQQCKKCALCGSEDIHLKTSEQKSFQEPDLFCIYHCANCGTAFSSPMTDSTPIYNLIYKQPDGVGGYARYYSYYREISSQEKPLEWLADKEIPYWGPYYAVKEILKLPKTAKILEVGSGLGYFTYAFKKAGFINISGVDISQEAVDKANRKFGQNYFYADIINYAENNKNTYDAIILTEVIEHIKAPTLFLKALSDLLREKGSIILTTPNKSFFPSSAVWNTDNPPVHYWWFGENSIEYLGKILSLSVSFIDFTSYYKTHYPGLFNRSNWEKVGGSFVFDKNGELLEESTEQKPAKGIFPSAFKKTKLYKSLSTFIYPRISKNIIISGKRSDVLCAILTKNK